MFTKDERYNIQLILFLIGVFIIYDGQEPDLPVFVQRVLHSIAYMILLYRGLKVLYKIENEVEKK